MPIIKKNQCTWLLRSSEFVNGKFTPAEYCGKDKQPLAKNPNYADEVTLYESFCPEHMAKWTAIRKEKAASYEDEDI